MHGLTKLMESIHSDAISKVEVKYLEGNKAQVFFGKELVENLELEKGDNLLECLSEYC